MKTDKVRKISIIVNKTSIVLFMGCCFAKTVWRHAWNLAGEVEHIVWLLVIIASQQIGAYSHRSLGADGKNIMKRMFLGELIALLLFPLFVAYCSINHYLFNHEILFPSYVLEIFLMQFVVLASRGVTLLYKWKGN